MRVTGLPRKLPKRASTVHLLVRDQFGEAVPGVSVTVTGHAFSTNALTDAHGSAIITLAAGHGSLHVSLSAPTYRTLTTLIK